MILFFIGLKTFVPVVGLEPTLLAKHDFESCASTNSATPAKNGNPNIRVIDGLSIQNSKIQSSEWEEKRREFKVQNSKFKMSLRTIIPTLYKLYKRN